MTNITMTELKNKIAIIILVWNDYTNTCDTIKSVLKSKGVDYDIIVVDNASTDSCIDKIKLEFSKVVNIRYLINDENWGYAEGNNIAIRYCLNEGYEYFFILNNDVVFDSESCIHDMWEAMAEDKSIGIIAPVIWNKKGNGSFAKGSIMTQSFLYRLMMRLNGIKIGEYTEGLYHVPTVSGSFMALSKNNILKNGGFEKNFFMYAEEDDLCIRTNMSGFKVVKLARDYGIKHLGGILDFAAASDWKRVIAERNRVMLTRTFPFSQRFLYCSLLYLQSIRLEFILLKKRKFKSACVFSFAFFEGLYDLIFFKRLSKTDKLFRRGQRLAVAKRIYAIKIK